MDHPWSLSIPLQPLSASASSGSGRTPTEFQFGAHPPTTNNDVDGHSSESLLLNPASQTNIASQTRLDEFQPYDGLDIGSDVKPWSPDDPHIYPIPKPEAKPESDAWAVCFELGRKYDKERCDAWRDEVDKLLLFAALFSAVVTAFTVEASKLLQVDHEEAASALLFGIQQQLDNIVRQNTTAPALIPNPKLAFKAPQYAINVNVCWFLSLTLSLTTVSLGILCLQWLREYQREANVAHRDAISLRYLRFHGLERWRVPSIIAGLPLLLQGALILFFAGMVILLWNTSKPVAIVVASAVGVTVLFLLLTTILPPIQSLLANESISENDHRAQCPYKSPQAWAIRPLVVGLGIAIAHGLSAIGKRFKNEERHIRWKTRAQSFRKLFKARDWSESDMLYRHTFRANNAFVPLGGLKDFTDTRGAALGLAWVARMFTQNVRAIYAFIHCAEDIVPLHGRATLAKLYSSDMGPDSQGYLMPYLDMPPQLCSEALQKDIFLAYVLDYFALRNEQLRRPFFKYRFELFMRILNAAGAYLPAGEAPARTTAFLIPEAQQASMMQSYTQGNEWMIKEIPVESRVQYFEMVWLYMKTVRVQHVSFLLSSGDLPLHLLVPDPSETSPLHMDPTLLDRASVLNKRMEVFVTGTQQQVADTAAAGSSSTSTAPGPIVEDVGVMQERVAKAIIYVSRIYGTITSAPQHPEHGLNLPWDEFALRLNHIDYVPSFISLVRAIHTRASASSPEGGGVPETLLSPLEQQRWRSIKAKMIPEVLPEGERDGAVAEQLLQDQLAQVQATFRALGLAPLDFDIPPLGQALATSSGSGGGDIPLLQTV